MQILYPHSFLIILVFWSNLLYAAPEAKMISFWDTSQETSHNIIDHKDWQTLLDHYLDGQHVSGINRFNYAGLAKNQTDKNKLNRYLDYLQQQNPHKYARNEQKAYWINLYNALTVKIVLDHYPVESITKIHNGWFAFGPWNDVHAVVLGKNLTLNNIEHGILRPIWKDNRIHYAVNCASMGCPNLSTQAFTAANTESLLEEAAKNYINHPRAVQFKQEKLLVSSIYHWYKVDFGGSDSNLIKHLFVYAEGDLKDKLQTYQGSIDHDYNWQLNQP